MGSVEGPKKLGPLPEDATLATKDLYIAQALELCTKVLAGKSQPDSDRAIAVCWIAHLVADAHQPCHAGSLYALDLFPDGDRGANSIKTKQSKNMHALWDGRRHSPQMTDGLQSAADGWFECWRLLCWL